MRSLISPITDMLVFLRILDPPKLDPPKREVARYRVPPEHTRKVLELSDKAIRETHDDPWLRLAGYDLWTYLVELFPELKDAKGLELDYSRTNNEGWLIDLSDFRSVDVVRYSK